MKKRTTKISNKQLPVDSVKQMKDTALDEIQRKLANSSALNGGFETLLFKIDKIEESQGQLVGKVDKIHEAIYDPNEGIFSRLSEYKLENTNELNTLTKNITEITEWKKHREKEEAKEEETIDKASLKILTLEKSVDSLVKSKDSFWSVFKWFLVAFGGGVVTLLFSWLETKIK